MRRFRLWQGACTTKGTRRRSAFSCSRSASNSDAAALSFSTCPTIVVGPVRRICRATINAPFLNEYMAASLGVDAARQMADTVCVFGLSRSAFKPFHKKVAWNLQSKATDATLHMKST